MKRSWGLVYFLSVLFLTPGCNEDNKKPGYEFLPDMAHSVPYDAFAPNPNFKDGKTLRSPVPGTIARGQMPYPYTNDPGEAEKAGAELRNPYPATPENLARGEKVYQNFCMICHGITGEGDGPLIPKYPNPPSFGSASIRNYPDGRLFHVITVGVGEMASYATQISPEDRWKLVLYLNKLMGSDKATNPEGNSP